jgi:glycosyltransferase involved in cell wall biosynthesis
MRILFVADEYLWPPRSGYRQRIVGILAALAQLAEVDVFTVVPDGDELASPPADAGHARLTAVPTRPRAGSTAARLRRWLFGSHPRSLLWRDWTGPRSALAAWADGGYAVVWFSHATSYLAMGDLLPPPHIVDLDNLVSSVLQHRRAAGLGTRHSIWHPRAALRGAADAIDARRWRRAEEAIASRAQAVVVCSDLDRRRLNRANTWIVPNGYELPRQEPADSHCPPVSQPVAMRINRPPSRPPVLLLVGLLRYEPNRDAASYFASCVLPLVRAVLPEAKFLVVGHYDSVDQIAGLSQAPGVTVTGEVEDLSEVLAAAAAAVVPIRFGGGTRIKILEAFAWGLPVISTSIGAEGLEVVDGEHLLIADTPQAMAQACLRVLIDDELSVRLAAAGRTLWATRYRWSKIAEDVRATVRAVVGSSS